MFNLTTLFGYINTPLGIGVFAGIVTMAYLILMSINSYLPPVLLMSFTIGYIVYYVQGNCGRCPLGAQYPQQVSYAPQQPMQQPVYPQVQPVHPQVQQPVQQQYIPTQSYVRK
jgi:hypothetical protein